MMNEETVNPERVTLELLGINKKWVHAGKRGWIDLKDLANPPLGIQEEIETEEVKSKKWWKFW